MPVTPMISANEEGSGTEVTVMMPEVLDCMVVKLKAASANRLFAPTSESWYTPEAVKGVGVWCPMAKRASSRFELLIVVFDPSVRMSPPLNLVDSKFCTVYPKLAGELALRKM